MSRESQQAARVFESLRVPLLKLVGVAGFRSLMARSFVLAAAEFPWLDSVQVGVDGSLEGFDAARGQKVSGLGDEAGTVVVAQLLGLLITFVGEPLTLHLVRNVWPGAHADETDRNG